MHSYRCLHCILADIWRSIYLYRPLTDRSYEYHSRRCISARGIQKLIDETRIEERIYISCRVDPSLNADTRRRHKLRKGPAAAIFLLATRLGTRGEDRWRDHAIYTAPAYLIPRPRERKGGSDSRARENRRSAKITRCQALQHTHICARKGDICQAPQNAKCFCQLVGAYFLWFCQKS